MGVPPPFKTHRGWRNVVFLSGNHAEAWAHGGVAYIYIYVYIYVFIMFLFMFIFILRRDGLSEDFGWPWGLGAIDFWFRASG